MMNKYKLLSIIVLAAILTVPSGIASAAPPINGTPDDDFIVGTPGKDKINGQGGDDQILGLGGDDDLKGSGGQDLLEGGNGDDIMNGGGDDDVLNGGLGNDDMHGGSGDDWLLGNAGEDFLDGGSDNDVIDGGPGDDNVKGGTGDDRVFGGQGNDMVTGSPGDDVVEGGAGNDILFGDDGADRLSGGPGSDKLIGGLGPDEYFCGSTGETSANDNGTPGDVSDDFFGDIAIWDGGPAVIHDNGTPLDFSDDLQGEDSTPSADCEVTTIVDPRLGEGGAPPGGPGGEPGPPAEDPEFDSIEMTIQDAIPGEVKKGTANALLDALAESESLFASNGDADPTACSSLDDFETLVASFNDKKLKQPLRDDLNNVELPALRTLKECEGVLPEGGGGEPEPEPPGSTTEGSAVSKDANFSTQDDSFNQGQTLYMKIFSNQVDPNNMKKAEFELKDFGVKFKGTLTHTGDGVFEASIFIDENVPTGSGTLKMKLEDQSKNKFEVSGIDITINS